MCVSEPCVCVCETFQAALEVCELRLTEQECEESSAMRPLLFTTTVLKRCVCVLSTKILYLAAPHNFKGLFEG